MIKVDSIEKDARTPELVAGLLGIWEASVRASHHFLTEEDIRSLCPQAEKAVRQIGTLWVAYEEIYGAFAPRLKKPSGRSGHCGWHTRTVRVSDLWASRLAR